MQIFIILVSCVEHNFVFYMIYIELTIIAEIILLKRGVVPLDQS